MQIDNTKSRNEFQLRRLQESNLVYLAILLKLTDIDNYITLEGNHPISLTAFKSIKIYI